MHPLRYPEGGAEGHQQGPKDQQGDQPKVVHYVALQEPPRETAGQSPAGS